VKRQADNFVDFQQRAREFSVGDSVYPFGMFESQAGRVKAVWPAIGMVDVEFPTGERRLPVEDILKSNAENSGNITPKTDSGMSEMVPVSAGPAPKSGSPSAERVAKASQKQAVYWANRDRKYRMRRTEDKPCCPRCEEHPPLQRAIYKRQEGQSERLLGCPSCMFLIKDSDIINFNGPVQKVELEVEREAS
jgi:hypothetical protein